MKRARHEHIAALFLLVFLYTLVAAASYSGFYDKWGLRDNQPQTSIIAMLDGTAARPFIYRQMLPQAGKAVAAVLPPAIEHKLLAKNAVLRAGIPGRKTQLGLWRGDADKPSHEAAYYIVYLSGFTFWFFSLFLARQALFLQGATGWSATAAPAAFALALPILQSVGGFVYDFSEMFFLFAALCCVQPRWRWMIVPIAALAGFNKESYLFFVLALSPLFIDSRRDWKNLLIILSAMLVSGLVYLVERSRYAHNSGDDASFQLMDNLQFYANPLNLLRSELSYGLPLFSGYSLPVLMAVAALAMLGWHRLSRQAKMFTIACLAINIPLLLLFAAPGSTRNLSLLFPSLLFLIAGTLDHLRHEPTARPVSEKSPIC